MTPSDGDRSGYAERQRLRAMISAQQQKELHQSRHVTDEAERKTRTGELLDKITIRSVDFRDSAIQRCWRREIFNADQESSFKAEIKAADDEIFFGAETMVGKRMAGEHIFKDLAGQQRDDVQREAKMRRFDHELFQNSFEMRDFDSMAIGEVKTVTQSAAERKKQLEMSRNLEKFQRIDAMRREADIARQAAREKVRAAEVKGEQVRVMAEKLGTTGKSMSFEARAKARRDLLTQNEIADKLQDEADTATEFATNLKKKMQSQNSDEGSSWFEALAISKPGQLVKGIKAWFIGSPLHGPGLGTIYYGCYDMSDTPPVKGWMPYSANAKWPAPTLKVTKGTITLWIVKGADENGANGSYTKAGKCDGVNKFSKPDGITLFRTTIPEQPDLGFTAELLNPQVGATNTPSEVSADVLDKVPEDPPAIQKLLHDPFNFENLQKAGVRLELEEIRAKRAYKQQQDDTAQKEVEKLFEESRRKASLMLKQHTGGAAESDGSSVKLEKLAQKALDSQVSMLQAPNMTNQATEADISLLLGGEPRVFHSDATKVPPLDIDWVMLKRQPDGNWHPLKRQYYVNDAEKKHFESMRRSADCRLELNVLRAISKRESLKAELVTACKCASKRFQAHTDKVKHSDVAEILEQLERMRLATVETVEAIVAWRKYVEGQGKLRNQKDQTDGWIATISVSGNDLMKPSPAFLAKAKRHCRSAQPLIKETKRIYLGTFPTKAEAANAYDQAAAQQAVKLRTTADNMPKKQYVVTKTAKWVVSEGSGVTSAGSIVDLLEGDVRWTPAYMWNGQNYLLKIPQDTCFLQDCEPLQEFLGTAVALTRNPFFLNSNLDSMKRSLNAPMSASQDNRPMSCGPLLPGGVNSRGADSLRARSAPSTKEPSPLWSSGSQLTPMNNSSGLDNLSSASASTGIFSGTDSMGLSNTSKYATTQASGVRFASPESQKLAFGTSPDRFTSISDLSGKPKHSVPFGSPNTLIVKHDNETVEWYSHMAHRQSKITIGGDLLSSNDPHTASGVREDEFNSMLEHESSEVVELLDMVRVMDSVKAIIAEEELNDLLAPSSSRQPAESPDGDDDVEREDEEEDILSLTMEDLVPGEYDLESDKNNSSRWTKALYWQNNSALAIPQRRDPVKFRKENVWCRTDKGEWASLLVRGKHAKHFEYEVYLKRRGLFRQAQQKAVTRALIREQRRDLSSTDVERIYALIEMARSFHMNAVLTLEVDKADKFAKQWSLKEKMSRIIQRVFRGFCGRNRLMARKTALEEADLARKKWEHSVGSISDNFVATQLAGGLHKAVRYLVKPVVKPSLKQADGEKVMCTVHSLTTYDYWRRGAPPRVRCLACLRLRPMMRYNPKDGKWMVDAGPCWCHRHQAKERLLIRAYNPTKRTTYTKIVTEDDLRTRIMEEHDHIPPPSPGSWLYDACNYKSLPSDHVLGLTDNQGFDNYNEPTEIHPGLRHFYNGATHKLRSCSAKAIPNMRQSWEPSKEAMFARRKAQQAAQRARWLEASAVRRKNEASRAGRQASMRALENQDAVRSCHDAEEALTRAQREAKDFVHRAKLAIDFSSQQLEKFQDPTKASTEQSWEPLEDGNNWKMIREKRKKQLAARNAEQLRDEAHSTMFQAEMDAGWAAAEARIAEEKAQRSQVAASAARAYAAVVHQQADVAVQMLEEAMERVLTKLTLRWQQRGKTQGRQLVFYEPEWCPPRVGSHLAPPPPPLPRFPLCPPPHIILRLPPSVQSGYNMLRKVGMRVSSPSSARGAKRAHKYFVVSILSDPEFAQHFLVRGYDQETSILQEIHCEDVDIQPLFVKPPFRAENTARPQLYRPLVLHGTFKLQEDIRRKRQLDIADGLLRLLKLDVFTGLLRVGRLLFFQRLRMLEARMFLPAHWWEDMCKGKTRHRGHEIFREGRRISGAFMHLSVFENNGDLMFQAYDRQTGSDYSLRVSFHEITSGLRENPAELFYWLSSVRWCKFDNTLLRRICDRLELRTQPSPLKLRLAFRNMLEGENSEMLMRRLQCFHGKWMICEVLRSTSKALSVVAYEPRTPPGYRICPQTLEKIVEYTSTHGGTPLRYSLNIDQQAMRLAVADDRRILHPKRREELHSRLLRMVDLRSKMDEADSARPLSGRVSSKGRTPCGGTQRYLQQYSTNQSRKSFQSTGPESIGAQVIKHIEQFNKWINHTRKWRNPIQGIPDVTIQQWAREATANETQECAGKELFFSNKLKEEVHWEAPLYKGLKTFVDNEELIVDIFRPPDNEGEKSDLLVRVRPEEVSEIEARNEQKTRTLMSKEEARCKQAWQHQRWAKEQADKRLRIERKRIEQNKALIRREMIVRRELAGEERLRQENEKQRILGLGEEACKKQQLAVELLGGMDLKLAEGAGHHFEEFLALASGVKLMGRAEWAQEERGEEDLKDQLQRALFDLPEEESSRLPTQQSSRPGYIGRPTTADDPSSPLASAVQRLNSEELMKPDQVTASGGEVLMVASDDGIHGAELTDSADSTVLLPNKCREWTSLQLQMRQRRNRHQFGKAVDLRALTLAGVDESGTDPGVEPPGPLLLSQYGKCLGGTYFIISVSSTHHSRYGLRFEAYDPECGDSRVLYVDVTEQLAPVDEGPQVDPVLELIKQKQQSLVREIAVALDYYTSIDVVPPAVVEVGVEGLLDYFAEQNLPENVPRFVQYMQQILKLDNSYPVDSPSPNSNFDSKKFSDESSTEIDERLRANCLCMGKGLSQWRPPQRLGRREAQLQEQRQWALQLRGFCMGTSSSVLDNALEKVSQCSVNGSQATKARLIREKQRAHEDSLRPRQLLIPNDRSKPISVLQLEPSFDSPEVTESELACGVAAAMGYIELFQTGEFEVVPLPDDTEGVLPGVSCSSSLFCGGITSVGLEHQEDEIEGYYFGDHPQPPAFNARWMFESHTGFNKPPERLYGACNQRASLLAGKPVFGDVVWRRVGGTRKEQENFIVTELERQLLVEETTLTRRVELAKEIAGLSARIAMQAWESAKRWAVHAQSEAWVVEDEEALPAYTPSFLLPGRSVHEDQVKGTIDTIRHPYILKRLSHPYNAVRSPEFMKSTPNVKVGLSNQPRRHHSQPNLTGMDVQHSTAHSGRSKSLVEENTIYQRDETTFSRSLRRKAFQRAYQHQRERVQLALALQPDRRCMSEALGAPAEPALTPWSMVLAIHDVRLLAGESSPAFAQLMDEKFQLTHPDAQSECPLGHWIVDSLRLTLAEKVKPEKLLAQTVPSRLDSHLAIDPRRGGHNGKVLVVNHILHRTLRQLGGRVVMVTTYHHPGGDLGFEAQHSSSERVLKMSITKTELADLVRTDSELNSWQELGWEMGYVWSQKLIAERLSARLIINKKNGRPTLMFQNSNTLWAEQRTQRENKYVHQRVSQCREEHDRDLVATKRLRNEVREARLTRFRAYLSRERTAMRLIDMVSTLREWPQMAAEEVESHSLRSYLTCDYNELKRIEWGYGAFHKRKYPVKRQLPLTTDLALFQELLFELGTLTSRATCGQYAKQLKTNDKGNVELHEFALWWLIGEHQRWSEPCSRKTYLWLRSKKEARQARRVATHAINQKINQLTDFAEKRQRKASRVVTKVGKTTKRIVEVRRKKLLAVGVRNKQRAIRLASKMILRANKAPFVKLAVKGARGLLDLPSSISQGRRAAQLKAEDRKMRKLAHKKMAEFKKQQTEEKAAIDDAAKPETLLPEQTPGDESIGEEPEAIDEEPEEVDKDNDQTIDDTLEHQEAEANRALEEAELLALQKL